MSFLPYLVGISLFFVLISFIQLRKKMKPWYPHQSRRYFRGISFLIFCVFFFILSRQFNHFYSTESPDSQSSTGALTILFANIHKDNKQYDAIEQTISEANPDMLMFVEFADHHYDHLKTFLEKNYPYTNNTTRSKTFIGSMVFSKYPITNKADDFPQGTWRYGYFSIPYKWQELYFYLVHTSSPDSYAHFLMRNEQLQTFVDNFKQHESDRKHHNIVVVGDFNITPRSNNYPILDSAFSGDLVNATKCIPFLFTWKLKELPLFLAHIDHLRSTNSLKIDTLNVLDIPGSDHKWFLFTLDLWTTP